MSKAFDKLDHFILLNKIRVIGFHEGFIRTVKNFLIDIYQLVFVSGVLSALSKVSSRVPQGTVLGPRGPPRGARGPWPPKESTGGPVMHLAPHPKF